MLTAITLVALSIVFRLLTPILHGWNFVPMGAVALYAGARLPRRWAWAVPVVAMAIPDLILDYGTERPELARWTIYATFAGTTLLGRLANRPRVGPYLLPLLSLGASMVFFVTSNLATWAEGLIYPLTFAGLVDCFVLAIPFYKNTVIADLLGTAIFFGLGPVFARLLEKSVGPRLAKLGVERKATDRPSTT
jgi:hypothetical protein